MLKITERENYRAPDLDEYTTEPRTPRVSKKKTNLKKLGPPSPPPKN